jgi:adenine-specific DNA-methyltransferase
MAYVKQWAPRSFNPLELRVPEMLDGPGHAIRGDACHLAGELGEFDVAYLDPPYNQHRYFTNYHIWETLVAWDAPDHYGIACKRIDARDPSTKSVFNDRRRAPDALASVISAVNAGLVVVSASNEGWLGLDDLIAMCEGRGQVEVLAFDSRRYVGAQIGIHNLRGEKVGRVSHTRNTEYVLVAGDADLVGRVAQLDSNRNLL